MNNLRHLRHRQGWTQDRMALALGTTRNAYVKLENGTRQLTLNWIERVAAALTIDPGAVIRNAPVPKPIVGSVMKGGHVQWTDQSRRNGHDTVSLIIQDGVLGSHFDGWRLHVSLTPIEIGSVPDQAFKIFAQEAGSSILGTLRRDPTRSARTHLVDLDGRLQFDVPFLYALDVRGLVSLDRGQR